MATAPVETATQSFYLARGLAYRAYHRLTRANYDRGWLVRKNETPAGSFRCYEPLNRHGSDRMLAEVDAACGSDATIVDVGANVGIYALALTSAAPERRVFAVEPAPPTVERLRANVRLNAREDRIDVRACGLGDESGTRRFYRSSNPELSSFDPESARRWGASVVGEESVPIYRLDDLVGSTDAGDDEFDDVPPPDAIKIDVEGTAPDVLRGARDTLTTHRPTVFVEIHEAGLEGDVPAETKGVLEDCGYEIRNREGYWRCEPR